MKAIKFVLLFLWAAIICSNSYGEGLLPVYADISGRVSVGDACKDWDYDRDEKCIMTFDLDIDKFIMLHKNYIYIYHECYYYTYDNIIEYDVHQGQEIRRGKLIGYVANKEDTFPEIAKTCHDQFFYHGEKKRRNEGY